MKDTALFFLHQVAKTTNNLFAIALFNKLKNDKKDDNLKDWKLLDLEFKEDELLEELDNNGIGRNQDYRFLSLYLKGFRKFPFDKFYGVPFCSTKEETSCPPSILIQGWNGSGKTSVFSALEYLFTGQMSSLEKQRLYENEIKGSIPYAKKDINDVFINVTTKTNHFSFGPNANFQSIFGTLSLYPFFCSEYDVDNLLENRLTKYVYDQMGYGRTKHIIDKLTEEIHDAISKHEDFGDVENIDAQIANLNGKIKVYRKFKTSFLDILLDIILVLQEKSNWKEIVKEIISELSKRFIRPTKRQDLSNKEKLLNKNSLKKERKLVCISNKNELSNEYSEIEKAIQANTNDYDPIELFPLVQSIEKRIDYFNLERECLRDFIQIIFNNYEEKTDLPDYDYDTIRVQYDTLLDNIQKDIESKEKTKLDLERFIRYNTNRVVYDEFLKNFKNLVYGTVNKITGTFKDFVMEVSDLFLVDDEEMLSFGFNVDTGSFNMEITLNNPDYSSTATPFKPREYLNTFRYKLYCMTLKFVVAFTIKKFYNINFPIIIDDIFYSSDFSHRNMVRDYFRALFKKHDELFPKEDQKLQVIFFSHDEVVIDAAYRGIRDVTPNVNRLLLYDYREVWDEDIVKVPVNPDGTQKEQIEYTKLTDSLDI